jgi:hypothetical protein
VNLHKVVALKNKIALAGRLSFFQFFTLAAMKKLSLFALALLAGCLPQTSTSTPITGVPNGPAITITSFTAEPNPFRIGDAVTLEWTTKGEPPTRIELEAKDFKAEPLELFGASVTIFPDESHTYLLTVESVNGTDTTSLELVMAE